MPPAPSDRFPPPTDEKVLTSPSRRVTDSAVTASFAAGTASPPTLSKTGEGTLVLRNPVAFFPANLADAVQSVSSGLLTLKGDAGSSSSYRISAGLSGGSLPSDAPAQHLKGLSLSNGSNATLTPSAKVLAVR